MIDRVLSSLVALSLALLVWLYARSRDQEILDHVTLPVQISLAQADADHYSLEVNGPAQAVVSFSGPADRINELRGEVQRNELHIDVVLSIPEERRNQARYSDTVHVEADQVPAPPGVTPIVSEGRTHIPVTIRHLVTRELPVTFDPLQEEPPGPVMIEPLVVRVTAPQEVFDNHRSIPTVPSVLPSRPADAPADAVAVGRIALVQELDGLPVRADPAKVTIKTPTQPARAARPARRADPFPLPARFHPAAGVLQRPRQPGVAPRHRPKAGRRSEGVRLHRPDAWSL